MEKHKWRVVTRKPRLFATTLREIANRLDCSQSRLSQVVNGSHAVSWDLAKKMAAAIGIEPAAVMDATVFKRRLMIKQIAADMARDRKKAAKGELKITKLKKKA